MGVEFRRITWAEAEELHPGCTPALDHMGWRTVRLFDMDPHHRRGTWFAGGRLIAVGRRYGRSACLSFDPRVGLWVYSFMAAEPEDALAFVNVCSIEWFKQRWCVQRNDDWRWDADAHRYRSQKLALRRLARCKDPLQAALHSH